MDMEVKKLLKKIEDHEKRIQKLESLVNANLVSFNKKASLNELMLSKKPKTDVQKTLLIGYYLEKYKNMPYFDIDDILKGFRDAKEKAPPKKKIYDKIASNIKKRYMTVFVHESKSSKKTWMLTNSGVAFVENDFKD